MKQKGIGLTKNSRNFKIVKDKVRFFGNVFNSKCGFQRVKLFKTQNSASYAYFSIYLRLFFLYKNGVFKLSLSFYVDEQKELLNPKLFLIKYL